MLGEQNASIAHKESPQVINRIDNNKLNKIIATLEQSPIDKALVQDIKARFEDLIVLDQNLEAIRREIVNPVTNEMKQSNRLAVVALVITIIALVLTILTSNFLDKLIFWILEP